MPVVNDLVAANHDVRIEPNDLPLEFSLKAGHHRDDDNKYTDSEDNSENRDQCDDGEKSALRLQVAQREEVSKWQPNLLRHEVNKLFGMANLPRSMRSPYRERLPFRTALLPSVCENAQRYVFLN